MAGAVREAPREFEAKLRAMWPDFRRIEYDQQYCRWRFFFTSAAGRECSIVYCWDRDPHTGGPPETDPVTGLRPFRDLDAQAQAEIIFHGERTSLTNPVTGAQTWLRHTEQHLRDQRDQHQAKRAKDADDYAYLLQQMDLRRPWVKDHQRAPKGSGMQMGHGGSIKAKEVKPKGIIRPPSFGKGRKTEVPNIPTGVFA